jgi:hypothetical protein
MDDTCVVGGVLLPIGSPEKPLNSNAVSPTEAPLSPWRWQGAPAGFEQAAHPRAHRRGRGVLGLLLPGLLLLVCGCVPLRFNVSPGATGRVVDAGTHAPVSGAEIVISRSTYPPESAEKAFSNSRSPTVMSDDKGMFSLPVERRMDLYCVPVDAFPRFGLLVIKRAGYATTCVPFWSHSVADLGQVPIAADASSP